MKLEQNLQDTQNHAIQPRLLEILSVINLTGHPLHVFAWHRRLASLVNVEYGRRSRVMTRFLLYQLPVQYSSHHMQKILEIPVSSVSWLTDKQNKSRSVCQGRY